MEKGISGLIYFCDSMNLSVAAVAIVASRRAIDEDM